MTKCKICGKEFVKKSGNQIYCCKRCKMDGKNLRRYPNADKSIEKKCKECSKLFKTKNKIKVYCSSVCMQKYNKKLNGAYKWKKILKECPECNKKFYPTSYSQIFCNRNCTLNAQTKKRAIVNKRHWTKDRVCNWCGSQFVAKTWHQKYCGIQCKIDNYNKSKLKKWNRNRICEYCGKDYIANNGRQKFCSEDCQKNISGKWMKLRFEIFKRDNFTCQYCGRNVKEDKIKLHCDHALAKANNGNEFHPDNLITSCLECNEGKSDVLLEQRQFKK